MRILLDTHVLLWSLSNPKRLKPATLALINESDIYASAASIWEISIKAALGKLEADSDLIVQGIDPAGFSLLSINAEHAARVNHLAAHHRDPFDRLLVAQAELEAMTLLTNDSALTAYGDFVRAI